MFINIYISSKNKNSLIRFLKLLQTFTDNKYFTMKIIQIKFNKLKHKKIFTILKSPHVNKTAQTQFEYILNKKQITIFTDNSLKFLFFLKIILEKLFSDIVIKIKIYTNIQKISNIHNIKNIELFKYNTEVTLKYLDVLGETCFKLKKFR